MITDVLFHPEVLKILHEWKRGREEEVPLDLIALLVEGKQKVDYYWMDKILYSYKKTSKRRKDRVNSLKKAVESNFDVEVSGEGNIYFLKSLDGISKGVRSLLKRARKKKAKDKGISGLERDTEKEEANTSGMLRFIQVEGIKKPSADMLGLFSPICFDKETAVSMPSSPLSSTIRIRKDIQDPRRLSFIKFSNQLRPPLYGFGGQKHYVKNSLTRLPQVLDYEEDSDWEDCEDAEVIESTEEESSEEESSCEWIELDSERMEPSRTCRKPCLGFPSCKFTIFPSFCSSWISLPLVEREVFPEELLGELEKELLRCKDLGELVRRFGSKYVVKASVVSDKLRDLGVLEPHKEINL
ncbi:uncharacterized protein Eint_091150 [Encephalitozoon intestinalis ATCC 50506]|uniref:Chromatin assembly factor 1 subunit A dimerization domain-containing protein n=1 Tax=Encephalitozoon intestinalis (strain ATCC 50506) TaxID=876142 RepID=E0S8X8_ENCIT|nr:uncharacterized protein Eint_091150 [Encephalitozoon intestinalis ATCC 50506]ADM12244.1 hypothetical protein Eint_091150 [Encephalitozoon intestinalis ATCC 50506]UTX45989.1 hypothetical protein GPK93_09g15750 [Encephalitozoon intestinalis]